MQQKNQSARTFLERTEVLKVRLGTSYRKLAGIIGISEGNLFGGRSGKLKITDKTWKKLEQAEQRSMLQNEAYSEQSMEQSGTYRATQKEVQHALLLGAKGAAKKMTDEELIERISEHVEKLKTEAFYMRAAHAEIIAAFAFELSARPSPTQIQTQ